MNLMIAIISCEKDQDRGCHQAIRETWLRTGGNPMHKFILGGDSKKQAFDEFVVNTGDGYDSLYKKSNFVMRVALDLDMDYVFLCDVDTYVVYHRLLASGFDRVPYMGWRCDEGHAGQGHGIWFSRQAMSVLANDPCTGGHFDLYAGNTLAKNGIVIEANPQFLPGLPKNWAEGGITAHLGRGTGNWKPEWMYECHKQFLEQTNEG